MNGKNKRRRRIILTFVWVTFFLSWGSFLNVIAYRLISGNSLFTKRSYCPQCKTIIAWYDNIPIISWLLLKGHCRSCKKPISWLYPFTEIITALSALLVIHIIEPQYWAVYFFFFSALIISIRTDLEHLLLSRYVTLGLIPISLGLSYFQFLPISIEQSLIGSISAYTFLFTISYSYYLITKRVGLGQGDIELLAGIGSFLGFFGWWFTLLLASLLGSFTGFFIILFYNRSLTKVKIPFGPFLALGAMTFVLCNQFISSIWQF
ncbi:MAG: prepilin peptidase [Candidatus Babeliales bacterium]